MNKIIPFNKDIKFNEKIGEITSIALDDNLKFKDSYTISGDLIVRGTHTVEMNEKDFSYSLPTQIAVDNKYDTSKAKISVDDFYYEIINDDILRVKIDLILDDLYYKETKIEPSIRDITMDDTVVNNNELDDINKEDKVVNEKDVNDVTDLFKEQNNEKEYSIYRVYLVLADDTIDKILSKYHVIKEDLSYYNDLDNLRPGMKLIIPSTDE